MLNTYKRQIISQIMNNNGNVLSFTNVKKYIKWLKMYTQDSNLIQKLSTNTDKSMGTITVNFIMHCKEESKVISFTKKILLRLSHLENMDMGFYNKEINTLKSVMHSTTNNIFPVKNLRYINNQVNYMPINNEITNLFDNFKMISSIDDDEEDKKDKENKIGEKRKNIIQHSELLLFNTFDYILKQHGYKINKSIEARANTVYDILNLNVSSIKLNDIPDIKMRNRKKSNRALNKMLDGLRIIINKFSNQLKITDGMNEIFKGLKTLRGTTSDAHTETVTPTTEETIFSLNISSSLSRYLIYKSKNS